MKLNELIEKASLTVINDAGNMQTEVAGGYTSDLLSDVMGNVGEGMVWITLQVHRNIIAVASLKEVAAIVLIGGAELEDETLEQARKQGVTVLATEKPSFETSGVIYGLLNR